MAMGKHVSTDNAKALIVITINVMSPMLVLQILTTKDVVPIATIVHLQVAQDCTLPMAHAAVANVSLQLVKTDIVPKMVLVVRTQNPPVVALVARIALQLVGFVQKATVYVLTIKSIVKQGIVPTPV